MISPRTSPSFIRGSAQQTEVLNGDGPGHGRRLRTTRRRSAPGRRAAPSSPEPPGCRYRPSTARELDRSGTRSVGRGGPRGERDDAAADYGRCSCEEDDCDEEMGCVGRTGGTYGRSRALKASIRTARMTGANQNHARRRAPPDQRKGPDHAEDHRDGCEDGEQVSHDAPSRRPARDDDQVRQEYAGQRPSPNSRHPRVMAKVRSSC